MLRVKIIEKLIHINENLVFYPRLRRYYKQHVSSNAPTIIDVGANKGQSIDFFLKIYPNSKIYAFEPNGRLFRFLVQKYNSNNNIKLFNCGVSDEKTKLLFNESILDETSTFEELNYDSKYLKMKSSVLGVKTRDIIKDRYEVDVIKLNDFIAQENIKSVDILKIDTEGHEYRCLKGLFSGGKVPVKLIQLEHHEDNMYINKLPIEEMSMLLKQNSYQLHRKIKHGFGDFYEMIYRLDT